MESLSVIVLRMSIVALVAKRFLTGKKRNTFLSFIAGVSLFGVCVGVAALTVVMGVMEGFESQIRSIVTGTHSHVMLYSGRQIITNRFDLEERVRRIAGDDIEAMSPYIFSEVMLAKGSRVVGSMVEGVEENISAATLIKEHLVKGVMPEKSILGRTPTIILGSVIAESLHAEVDDEITMISPFFDKDGMQPRSRKFKVAGILSTGMYDYDSKYSMMDAEEARDFFRLPSAAASAFKIKTKNPDQSRLIADKIEAELGAPFRTKDWTELNRNLLYAIKLQKSVIFIILTAIIVVAAFNIMSTLMMMMSEKKKELSILKAMGLSSRKTSGVFVTVGFLIGTAGAVAGVSLGLLLGFILAKTRFIHLPPDVYFISYLPVDIRPLTLGVISVCALVVALLATLYPAYRVAMESPVEGLRYE